MAQFYTKQKKFNIPQPQFPNLGQQFRNIKPRETFDEFSRNVFSDRLILTFIIAWFFPILVLAIFLLLNISKLPFEIPLYYSQVWGVDQLAPRNFIALPLIGAFILGATSFMMVNAVVRENKVLAYIIAGSAPLVTITAVITTMKIVNLVR